LYAGAEVLRFEVQSDGRRETVQIVDPFLVICGYTGRDEDAVAAHVRELADMGVAPPEVVPLFIAAPPHLLIAAADRVEVMSAHTSGEAEPVLIRTPEGQELLAVGSDHTDRALEATSVAAAKGSCPKVLSTTAWELGQVAERWDDLVLTSASDGGPAHHRATLSGIKTPAEILNGLAAALDVPPERPLVTFLGTLAGSAGGTSSEGSFSARLDDPVTGWALECAYDFVDLSRRTREVAA
jgi:hypothetical protein